MDGKIVDYLRKNENAELLKTLNTQRLINTKHFEDHGIQPDQEDSYYEVLTYLLGTDDLNEYERKHTDKLKQLFEESKNITYIDIKNALDKLTSKSA